MQTQDNFLCHINLPIDIELLRTELSNHPLKHYKIRQQESWPEDYKVDWLNQQVNIRHRKTTGYIKDTHTELTRIMDMFTDKLQCILKPVYIVQRKNTELPYHRDSEVMPCAINILLDDASAAAPITFRDFGDINYKAALVNISEYHKVNPYPSDRHLLKICIYDKPFETCKELLNEYLQSY